MSAFGMVETVMRTYPETSPFELGAPVFNLLPEEDPFEVYDDKDVKHAALSIARSHAGYNVFSKMYGSNPLPLDNKFLQVEFPFISYSQPPPIGRLVLPPNTRLAEIVATDSYAATILASAEEWSAPRLLKVFFDSSDAESEVLATPFARELEAYAHLSHYGACAKGAVPACFGWSDLTDTLIEQLVALSESTRSLLRGASTAQVLVLEHIPYSEKVSLGNLSLKTGRMLLQALVEVHASYVHRGTLRPSDMWFVPSPATNDACRVVWMNFVQATCASDGSLHRQDFYQELRACWDCLFARLRPAERIGYAEAFDE